MGPLCVKVDRKRRHPLTCVPTPPPFGGCLDESEETGSGMDDEHEQLLCEWHAAREAYDDFLRHLFAPGGTPRSTCPSDEELREAACLREAEDAAKRRYDASRDLESD